MPDINELYEFYLKNEDFKTFIDKCVNTYGKDVMFMLGTPIAYEYYKQLRGDKK